MTGVPRDWPRRRGAVAFRETGVLLLALLLGPAFSGCAGSGSKTPSAAEASAPEVPRVQQATVRAMEVSAEGPATRIRLDVSPAPGHRVIVADDASRIELDLYNVAVGDLPPRVEVGDGTVESIEVRSVPPQGARVSVQLSGPGDGRVAAWEGGLDLLVERRGTSAGMDAQNRSEPAESTVRLLEDGSGIAFVFGSEPSDFARRFTTSQGNLVVDVVGVEIPAPEIDEEFGEGPVKRVKMGRSDEGSRRVRVIVYARSEDLFGDYRLEKRPDGFVVLFAESSAGVASDRERPGPSSAALPALQSRSPSPEEVARYPGGGGVTNLGFRQDPDVSRVEVEISKAAPHEVREVTDQRVVVDLLRTSIPKPFQRALDTSAFPGPVRLVTAYPRRGDTRIVVDLRQPTPFRLERGAAEVFLLFEGGSGSPPPEATRGPRPGEPEFVVVTDERGSPQIGPGAGPGEDTAADSTEPVYTGRRISMDFVDADIRNVLRLIGDVSGLNMVAGDDVQGRLTVRLVDVPWDQALDVILKTRGLDQVRDGNVIRVAPAERLAAERARALEEELAAEEKAPLITDIVAVNYASAEELLDKVESVLTERGSVSVDLRTNSLLIKDVVEQVEEARALVMHLDTQTPQVLIEARIVEVASTFERDLGIQWGGQFNADTAHGNSTDWAFPHSINAFGDTGAQDFAVNFPSAGGAAGGPGGALALNLGHVNDILSLDLRLSAIETSGRGRVISSPRVTTLDNKTAEILQGVEIPFTTATEEKIETQSIDYLLKLNVTPHVTADRSVIMQIQVTKDAPSSTFRAVDSNTPAVETRAATTEVLVKDGETTVIGGIITDTKGHTDSGLPFLSKIPGLGWLFRKKVDRDDKTELIIFITPKIANPGLVAQQRM